MRSGLVAIALAVTACAGENGVDIRINAMPGVTHVELFVAQHECIEGKTAPTCDVGIAWDDAPGKQSGTIFLLDVDDVTTAEPLADGSFRIQLQHNPAFPDPLQRVVVLGYGDTLGMTPIAAAELRNVRLPVASIQEWHIELERIEPILAQPPTSDVRRIHTWKRDAEALARCLVLEQWRSGQVAREFFVPPGDTDCDDVASDAECDPYYWNAPAARGKLAEATCRTDLVSVYELPNLSTKACLAGSPACSETMVVPQSCTPVFPATCMPSPMCTSQCGASAAELKSCIDSGMVARVECVIPTTTTGTPCQIRNFFIDFNYLTAQTVNECLPIKLSPLLDGPLTASSTATLGSIEVTAPGMLPSCFPRLEWTGTRTDRFEYALAVVPFSNNLSSIIPVRFELVVGACPQDPQCTTHFSTIESSVTACGKADAVF